MRLMKKISQSGDQVLFLYEGAFGGEIDEGMVNGFRENGYEVTCALRGTAWDPHYDIVVGYGPFTPQDGHLLTVARQVLALPPQARPLLVWWLTENPAQHIPPQLALAAAQLRLWGDKLLGQDPPSTIPSWQQPLMKAHRLRVLGQLTWARKQEALGILVVTNNARARYYRSHGFDPVVAPLGYHRSYGIDLGLPRTNDVAFMGQMNDKRRRRLLPGLFADLRGRGITVEAVSTVYGEERTQLLNRSRILINVLRAPQDFVGQRIMLGAANRTLVISEPMYDPDPFVPDKHMKVTAVTSMADAVADALQDMDAHKPMLDDAYRLVTEELTCKKMVQRILERAKNR